MESPMISRYVRIGMVVALLVCGCLSGGCAVKLVSSYDEQTDRDVTALQKKFDYHLLRLEDLDESFPACSYAANRSFYENSRAELSSIRVRAAAIPQNEITVQQLDALAGALSSMSKLHAMKDDSKSCLDKSVVEADRTAFNQIFTAIIKLEIAKKRGDN